MNDEISGDILENIFSQKFPVSIHRFKWHAEYVTLQPESEERTKKYALFLAMESTTGFTEAGLV